MAEVAGGPRLGAVKSNEAELTGVSHPALSGEDLMDALKKQVEYYFSRENLMNDGYLISKMNSDLFVPVEVIASFPKIRSLTDDHAALITAMKSCNTISMSEDCANVRPNLKTQRNTIILREIPASTDPEEVKGIFGTDWGTVEVKADIGDCWFVNFADDAVTLKALESIREKSFKGQPIRARIKTESTLRMFMQNIAANTSVTASQPWIRPITPTTPTVPVYPQYPSGGWENTDPNYQTYRGGYDANRRGGYRQNRRDRKEHNNGGGSPNGTPNGTTNNAGTGGGRGRNYRGNQGNRDSGRKRRGSNSGGHIQPQAIPNLGTTHFPPLVPTSPESAAAAGKKKVTGYQTDFKKFTKEQILDIVSNIKDAAKPEDITECKAVLPEPNFEIEVIKAFPKSNQQ